MAFLFDGIYAKSILMLDALIQRDSNFLSSLESYALGVDNLLESFKPL
jgi:hypothetical protein